ncbi:TonB-dependent receptor [Tamlana fucoidanivorans]|uniref:TonB-dependent receptor n=1 Tax=Allotamlana fucoidanivorans TaxID=2583814 RepID=A0A5C4SQX5_9FLAO|nr:TonB-dependent receptor [Tamlana fucoidanivorans]TNJ45856.1 TonB-dependent receptor [Tamlana fucoidanivorans]
MKYKIAFFLSCFIFLGQALGAQNIKVSGKIVDETGMPLIGANIISSNTSNGINGTVADFDGNYTITVGPNDTLSFTYVGYIAQEIKVSGKTIIDVTMMPDTEALEEVVVLGYNKVKKANVVGAVATVTGGELKETGLTNMSQAIQDRLPGVYTEIPSGQPGADDANITIRGVSSFRGNNAPLILIDGVEATGGFSQLDPSEIASISVLKDAASLSVYGVRGGNGVILITTNRGKEGSAKVSVGGAVTAKRISDLPQQLSSYDVLMLGQEAIKNSGQYGDLRPQRYIDNFLDPNRNIYAYPDINWYDELIRDIGWETNARVNVSGGTEFVKYFSSLSANHVGDILKTEDFNGYYDPEFTFDKINFRTNLDFDVSKSTKLSVDISGRSEITKTPNSNVGRNDFSNVFKFLDEATPYYFPLYYPKEFLLSNPDPLAPFPEEFRLSSAISENPFQENPYQALNYSGMRRFKKDVVDIQIALTQSLDAITKGLSVSGRFNYSTMFEYKKVEAFNPQLWLYDPLSESWRGQKGQSYYDSNPRFRSSGGEEYDGVARNLYYEFKLNYQRSFGVHNVAAVGVFNRNERETSVGSLPEFTEDWVGIFNYDYKEKYLLKLSGGYNGTERFAPGKRFAFFPSMAIGWNIAKEKIVEDNLPWLNVFKVRYSYGETGVYKNSPRFDFLGGYTTTSLRLSEAIFGFPANPEVARWAEVKIANPDATWETQKSHNLGFDVKLFNYELTLGLDLFKKETTGIAINEPRPSYFQPSLGTRDQGRVSLPQVNSGESKNHGFEFSANYRHLTPSGLGYSFGGHFTLADSRIVYRGDRVLTPDYRKNAGKPIGWLSGYHSNGFIDNFEETINAPEISRTRIAGHYSYADFNGDGRIDINDNIPLEGTSQPAVVYAFNGSVDYKGFDLSIRFFGKDGVTYHSSNLFPNFNGPLLEAKSIHLDRWSPTNPNADFPALGHISTAQGYEERSNQTIVNSSYLKLQNVAIGYSLKSEFLRRALKIEKMRLNLSGQNLYTWSKVPFGDPEGGNGVSGGYGQYPLVSRFIFGVNIDF